MNKRICDSCKKQITNHGVSVGHDVFFKSKDFCKKCSKPAEEYLKSLFQKLSADGAIHKK